MTKIEWSSNRRKYKSIVIFVIALLTAIAISLLPPLVNVVVGSSSTPLAQVCIDPTTIMGKEAFFRVGKSTQGRWWFIDPDGKPFFYKGVTSVNPEYPLIYSLFVNEKYSKDRAAFRETALKRLQSWNFNALGGWTAPLFWDRGMPYTVILDFAKVTPPIKNDYIYLPDVFDPEWLKQIDAKAKNVAAPIAKSKQLVGYFTDNELGWAQAQTPDRKVDPSLLLTSEARLSLLQIFLSLEEKQPGYKAAWDFVLKRHSNSLEQLAKDWQVEITSQETIKQWTNEKKAIVSESYLADEAAFSEEFARRYFQETSAAIHRYDPNHLILGCRFGEPPGQAIFAAIKHPWVDVVSANNYRFAMYDRIDIYYQGTQLPILNGEFSWGHKVFSDRPLPNEPAGGITLTERMIRNGEESLKKALTHPALVGYTWYRWVDLPGNTPPISVGLLNLNDEPNRLHTDLLKKINDRAEAIALKNNN